MIECKWVALKANGQHVKINVSDFNPEHHEDTTLRFDGPTLEQWLDAGNSARDWPPAGYARLESDEQRRYDAWRAQKALEALADAALSGSICGDGEDNRPVSGEVLAETTPEAAPEAPAAPESNAPAADGSEVGTAEVTPETPVRVSDLNAQDAGVMADGAKTADEAQAMLAEEMAGKARVTVVRRIQHRLEVLGG